MVINVYFRHCPDKLKRFHLFKDFLVTLLPLISYSVVLFILILKSFIIILFCFVADFYSHATECNIIQREV